LIFIVFLGLPVSIKAPNNSLLVSPYLAGDLSILTNVKDIEFYDVITGRDGEQLKELIKNKYPELNTIITCESQWDKDVCNKEYDCKAGMGLGQLIPKTINYCSLKLNKTIDPFNAKDNLECSLWLYIYEGNSHWRQSKSCWFKNVNKY